MLYSVYVHRPCWTVSKCKYLLKYTWERTHTHTHKVREGKSFTDSALSRYRRLCYGFFAFSFSPNTMAKIKRDEKTKKPRRESSEAYFASCTFFCFSFCFYLWEIYELLGSLMATTNQNTKIMYSNKNCSGSIWPIQNVVFR